MTTPASIKTGPTNTASMGKRALSMQAAQNSSNPVHIMMCGQRSTINRSTPLLSLEFTVVPRGVATDLAANGRLSFGQHSRDKLVAGIRM